MPFIFSPQSLVVVEQQSAEYTIRCAIKPTDIVSVAITGHTDHDPTSIDITTLTFTPSNYNDPQTLVISSVKETMPDNPIDEVLTLTHTATSNDDNFNGFSRDLIVAILDDTPRNQIPDVPTILLYDGPGRNANQITELEVTEGESVAYYFRLSVPSTGGRFFVLAEVLGLNQELGLSPTSTPSDIVIAIHEYRSGEYDEHKIVTVKGLLDTDSVDEIVTINHRTALAPNYVGVTAQLTVTKKEAAQLNIIPVLSISPATLTLTEGGASGTVELTLASRPEGNVDVEIGSVPAWLTIVPQEITLTPTDFVDVEVTLSVALNAITSNSIVRLTLTATSEDHSGSSAVMLTVTAIALCKVTLLGDATVIEEGDTRDFMVMLSKVLTADVVIPLTLTHVSTTASDVSIPASVTIEDGNTAETGTITTVHRETSFATNKEFRVSIDGMNLPSTVELGTPNQISYEIEDTNIEVSLGAPDLEISEGEVFVFFAERSAATSNAITLTLDYSDNALIDGTPPTSVTIAANATKSSNISLTAAVDNDTDDEELTIEITASSVPAGYALATNHEVVFEITDETVPSGIAVDLSVDATSIDEGESFVLRVIRTPPNNEEQPDIAVTIPLTYSGFAGHDGPSSVTIPRSRGHIDITITTTEDADATANEDLTVTLGTLPDGYDRGGIDSVDVEIADITVITYNIILDPSMPEMDEGESLDIDVSLSHQPTADVTVTVTSSSTELTIDDTDTITQGTQNTLVFTNANYGTGQTITVRAIQDADAVTDTPALIFTCAGNVYDTLVFRRQVTVGDIDLPTIPALSISPATLTLTEGGASGTSRLSLAGRPAGDVDVEISATGGQPAWLDIIAPDVIEPADYAGTADTDVVFSVRANSISTNQSVTLTFRASSDAHDGDSSVTLTVNATNVNPPIPTVPAILLYDGPSANAHQITELEILEGESKAYYARLSVPIQGDARIFFVAEVAGTLQELGLSSSATPRDSVNAVHQILAAEYETHRIITVLGLIDTDSIEETVTINHRTTGSGNYSGVTASLPVTKLEPVALSLGAPDLEISEGEVFVFFAERSAATSNAITLTLDYSDNALIDGTPPTSVTIAANATRSSNISLTAAVDNDTDDEELTIEITASSVPTGYALATNHEVVFEITDETVLPDIAVDLSVDATSIDEGGSFVLTVIRTPPMGGTQPNAAVTIPLTYTGYTHHDGPGSVTIARARASIAITITTTEDSDRADNADLTISLGTLPDGYDRGGIDSVDVEIGEITGLYVPTVAPRPISIGEGTSLTVSVVLPTQPVAYDVTVTITSSSPLLTIDDTDSGEQGVQNTLIFSSDASDANAWSTAQTITINAEQDVDTSDNVVALTFACAGDENYEGSSLRLSVTIEDDDQPVIPALSISPATLTLTEGRASGTVKLTLVSAPEGDVDVEIGSVPAWLTIVPQEITLTPTSFANVEVVFDVAIDTITANQKRTLTLTATSEDHSGSSAVMLTVNATNVDPPPAKVAVSLSGNTAVLQEGFTRSTLVVLASALAADVSIPLTLTLIGTVIQRGDVSIPSSVTIDAGDTQESFNILTNQRETDFSANKTFRVSIDGVNLPSTVELGTPSHLNYQVSDRDIALGLATNDSTIAESDTFSFYAYRDRAVPTAITLTLVFSDTTLFDEATPTTITIGAAFSRSPTITLTASDDTDTEDEELTISIAPNSVPTGYVLDDNADVEFMIEDETVLPGIAVNLSISPFRSSIDEGSRFRLLVRLSKNAPADVEIPLTYSGYSEHDGDDEIEVRRGRRSEAIWIRTTADADALANEDLTVTLGTLPDGYDRGGVDSVSVSIDETTTTGDIEVDFQRSSITQFYPSSQFRIGATLSRAPSAAVSIPIDRGRDTTWASSVESFEFGAGDTVTPLLGTIVIEPDPEIGNTAYGTKTVTVMFGTLPSGFTEGSVNSLTLLYDYRIYISIGDGQSTIVFGGNVIVFTVTLAGPAGPDRTISSHFRLEDGPSGRDIEAAVHGTDYLGVLNGTVSFVNGARTANINVLASSIAAQAARERRRFTVRLLNPTNCVLDAANSTGSYIIDGSLGPP